MMQDVPPARLDATAGNVEGEPKTVVTVDDLPEVAGADVPGPVDNTGSAERGDDHGGDSWQIARN